ncbi:MAG TPA: hypothetical protein VLB44_16535 [Kofleriaceae bacterium]|nr:hypothetical protein [Kofleriaceae bacterium]
MERALQPGEGMYISLDREQTDLLQEMLEKQLAQLRVESARTDTHDYREMLHRRERLIESMLAKMSTEEHELHPSV